MKIFKGILFTWLSLTILSSVEAQSIDVKAFYFGKKVQDNSGVTVNTPILYTEGLGYGFDFFTEKNLKLKKHGFVGDKSVCFSVKVPEGNYKVEVVLGGRKCTETTVKAESRRLMLSAVETGRKQTLTKSFTVHVKTSKIEGNPRGVRLKPREKGNLNWDDKLTLEFLGAFSIQSIKITPVTDVTTLFLAGDSTVTDQNFEPWASWGQFITNYFSDEIVVANHAASGLALSSFKSANRLEKVLQLMKPGDYLFIEFGHNDAKRKSKGNGPWESYSDLLREFVTKAREKHGFPVLVTPTQRRHFDEEGRLKETHGDFPAAMRKVANDLNVPLIDVTKMTTKMYQAWGDEKSKEAFVHYPANTFPNQTKDLSDNTHFNSFGADQIAKCILQGIKELNLNIAQYINGDFETYNPEKPNSIESWTVPISTRFDNVKPDGD